MHQVLCAVDSTKNVSASELTFDHIDNGYDFMLLKFLSKFYNFTYSTINGNMQFGSKVNGTWNGVVGLVERGVT